MKRLIPLFPLAVALLAGCGGNDASDNTTPPATASLSVTDLDPGAYVVSVGDADNPTVGKYYAGTDGSRYLALADAEDKATTIYRRDKNGSWVAAPGADAAANVKLLRQDPVPAASVDAGSVAGSYTAVLPSGASASFTVSAEGKITPGASACQLSGALSAHAMPNTLSLKLSASACGTVPATATGVLAIDTDYQPAAFRLIADDGGRVVDLWAYRD
ncbi:hypothetical protein [Cupriavidus sp. UYPR2.512]|uniref:hypothetical protein n=1 Tax=Cupriavidus sp. UYPR2.512 TaxID=1080187 RepID=UPI000360D322|nr:hypothetical protein [Cupriavidus sp. UYPR2.512]UIF90339.1 hypothetical protein KAF44_42200 [Cupriavidus necator]